MPNSDARTVRGLSIASLVLSALGILGWLVTFILVLLLCAGGAGAAIGSASDYYGSSYYDYYYDSDPYTNYYDPTGMIGAAGVSIGLVAILMFVPVALSSISLIASIMAMRGYNQPQRYGKCFGWCLAGAVTAFFGGGIIVTILLAIAAGLLSRLRTRNPFIGEPYGQSGAGPVSTNYNSYERPGIHITPDTPYYTQTTPQPQPQPGYVTPQPNQAPYDAAQPTWTQQGAVPQATPYEQPTPQPVPYPVSQPIAQSASQPAAQVTPFKQPTSATQNMVLPEEKPTDETDTKSHS